MDHVKYDNAILEDTHPENDCRNMQKNECYQDVKTLTATTSNIALALAYSWQFKMSRRKMKFASSLCVFVRKDGQTEISCLVSSRSTTQNSSYRIEFF